MLYFSLNRKKSMILKLINNRIGKKGGKSEQFTLLAFFPLLL